MTVKELSQLYYLGKEIELCQKQLAELEAQRGISAINMDGMPHTKGMTKSQIEQLAAEIVDLKAIIHAKQIECIHERNRLERRFQYKRNNTHRQYGQQELYRKLDCQSIHDHLCHRRNRCIACNRELRRRSSFGNDK